MSVLDFAEALFDKGIDKVVSKVTGLADAVTGNDSKSSSSTASTQSNSAASVTAPKMLSTAPLMPQTELLKPVDFGVKFDPVSGSYQPDAQGVKADLSNVLEPIKSAVKAELKNVMTGLIGGPQDISPQGQKGTLQNLTDSVIGSNDSALSRIKDTLANVIGV